MIDKVYFETTDGKMLCSDDFGLILASFDAPEPEPKIYRVQVDGADGDLDMTEWAGLIRYENRTVEMVFRDMYSSGAKRLANALHGRRCNITNSADPDWYYTGRLEHVTSETRKRVTDLSLSFTCSPYKLSKYQTKVQATVGTDTEINLKAARRAVVPQIKLTAQCDLTWEGSTYTKGAGTHTIPQIVLTDTPKILTVSGSGTITVEWKDGVI